MLSLTCMLVQRDITKRGILRMATMLVCCAVVAAGASPDTKRKLFFVLGWLCQLGNSQRRVDAPF
jgi:hypothetical protein